MLGKYLKINETALIVVILLIVAIPLFTSYQNKKIAEEVLQKKQTEELTEKIAVADFLAKLEEQEGIQDRLSVIAQRSKVTPLDRDTTHEYVYLLISSRKTEQAYTVMNFYFKETPKEEYWDDVDLWIDYTLASMLTKRCKEAAVGAWHITTKSTGGSEQYNFAESIMHQALNEEDCIE